MLSARSLVKLLKQSMISKIISLQKDDDKGRAKMWGQCVRPALGVASRLKWLGSIEAPRVVKDKIGNTDMEQ